MKSLVVEDEFVARSLMTNMLNLFGPCHAASSGAEALEAVELALSTGSPYQLICLDILMPPGDDGMETLKKIRAIEQSKGVMGKERAKVIMTTGVDDSKQIVKSFFSGECDAYLVKPITPEKLSKELKKLDLAD